MHEGVYIGTVSSGGSATIAANPHLKVMFGHAPEVPDADVRPFDPQRFAEPQAREQFLDRLAMEGAVADHLLRLRRAEGTIFWVELTARAEPDERGIRLRVEALLRDVSERKKLDDQSRDLYQQLVQAEKMAALGQTISGVAHELNNPLATILTWAERLVAAIARRIDASGHRHHPRRSQNAPRSIVRNLLTFARKRQSTRTMVDLNQVVRETLALRSYEQRVTNITLIEALAVGPSADFADRIRSSRCCST